MSNKSTEKMTETFDKVVKPTENDPTILPEKFQRPGRFFSFKKLLL